METKLRKIATDTSSLSEIIGNDRIYVDKTEFIFRMIDSGKYFFLSRPRRFGKSLTIDTIENIFIGNKELFRSLYIYNRYDFEAFPVIRLNMSYINQRGIHGMTSQLSNLILKAGITCGVFTESSEISNNPSDNLASLIESVRRKYGKKAVVLVDEYDYPLIENMRNEHFIAIRDELANFYNILKAEDENLRFCFLTGVTRFQHVSIFSKLNNLVDISDSPEYASICGYTDEEIDEYFGPYIKEYLPAGNNEETFREKIRKYYDGYRFSTKCKTKLYNPLSIGRFFTGGCSFDNFWIETGSQNLVNEIIQMRPELFKDPDSFFTYPSAMNTLSINELFTKNAKPESIYAFLVQTGYMTIKGMEYGKMLLSFPNREVADTINAKLLGTYGLDIDENRFPYLYNAFRNADTNAIISIFRDAYMNIPYDMFMEKENNYQIAFYSALMVLGFMKVEAEEKTNIGRIDIIVQVTENLLYIIELKLDDSAEKALNQIKERKYYEKYCKAGNTIHMLGINFSSATRNISDWKEEVMRC